MADRETRVNGRFVLDRNTFVSVGLTISLVSALVVGSWHWATVLHRLSDLEREAERLERKVDVQTADRWTFTDMRRLRDWFCQLNPDLDCPPVERN